MLTTDKTITLKQDWPCDHIWSQLLRAKDNPEALEALKRDFPHHRMVKLYAPLLERQRVGPLVIGQVGQSLDGRIATQTGDSYYINGDAGLDHLHRLRALVDVIVVGVGTVIADMPKLTVRRCKGPSPTRAIIDPTGRLPDQAMRTLHESGTISQSREIIVFRRDDGPVAAEVCTTEHMVPDETGGLSPHDIIERLWCRGCRSILIEGGANTLSRFIDAKALDRLHIIMSSVLIGSGLPGLQLPPIAEMSAALRPKTSFHTLSNEDIVFDCAFERDLQTTETLHPVEIQDRVQVAAFKL